MQTFKCMVVEDEPLAADVLHDYIANTPFLILAQTHPDAVSALEGMRHGEVDVIFLDIQLPKLLGLDFLKILQHPPQVIITTAYNDFALAGYEHNVVDYLLKPIEFDRFLLAVNKLKTSNTSVPVTLAASVPEENESLFLNSGNKRIQVYFRDILFIESLRDYVKITMLKKCVTVKMQLGQLEMLLPAQSFIRIHRSFIIARSKLDAYTATSVEISSFKLPVGRSYKELLVSRLENNSKQ
ncbi:MAG: LytTR family DNA-binding domain-containing protein [Chitinophagaceae bacterium]